MKKGFLVLVVLVLLTVPSLAARAEFVGGYLHTFINPTEVNDFIGSFNEEYAGEEENYVSEISSADGFYLGLTTTLLGRESAFKYEYLNLSTNGAFDDEWDGWIYEESLDINASVQGVCFEMTHELTGDLTLYGGLGYYLGTGDIDYFYRDYDSESEINYEATAMDAEIQVVEDYEYRSHYDLTLNGSLGGKVGAAYSYALGNGFSFEAGLGYRYLVMEVESELAELEGDYGPILTAGELDDLTADLSGLEISLGFSVDF